MSAAAFCAALDTMSFMPMAFVRYLQAGAEGMTAKAREQIIAKFNRANTLAAAAVKDGAKRIAALRNA